MSLAPLRPFSEILAEQPREEFVEVDGHWVHLERWGGAGPVVVVLHGLAASTYSFRKLGPLLGKAHQVIGIDLYGFGYSQRPAASHQYQVDGQADMVAGVMNQLGLVGAVVLGHSFGTLVALALAKKAPDRVNRLVLVSPAPPIPKTPWFLRLPGAGYGLYFAIRLLLSNPVRFRQVLSRAFFKKDEVTREVAEAYRRRLLVEGLGDTLRGFSSPPTAELCSGGRPVEVLAGRHDEIVSMDEARALVEAIPGATLHVLEESGHSGPEEEPEEVCRVVSAAAAKLARQES